MASEAQIKQRREASAKGHEALRARYGDDWAAVIRSKVKRPGRKPLPRYEDVRAREAAGRQRSGEPVEPTSGDSRTSRAASKLIL